MQQTFGVINHYIQDEGCGHDIICALWPVNSGENTGLVVLRCNFQSAVLYWLKIMQVLR